MKGPRCGKGAQCVGGHLKNLSGGGGGENSSVPRLCFISNGVWNGSD